MPKPPGQWSKAEILDYLNKLETNDQLEHGELKRVCEESGWDYAKVRLWRTRAKKKRYKSANKCGVGLRGLPLEKVKRIIEGLPIDLHRGALTNEVMPRHLVVGNDCIISLLLQLLHGFFSRQSRIYLEIAF